MREQISYRVNGVDARCEGLYKVAIVDSATDKVVWEMPEFKKNLILNGGMDLVYSWLWHQLPQYAIVGTGTRPNSYDSIGSGTTASQAGTTITSSGGTFDFTTTAAVGDVVKFASGETANVVTVANANHLAVDVSQTVGAGNFVIWKTSQTGLQTEVKRSNTYLTGSGNCGSSFAANVASFKRTIDFPTEVGSVTYTEIGLSPVVTANTSTFSRILLGVPLTITAGQRIRVVYQLNVTFTPSTASSKTAAIGGWPVSPSVNTDGQEQIQNLNVNTVGTNGLSNGSNGGLGLEPSDISGTSIFVSPSSAALAATIGVSVPDRTANAAVVGVTKASYTPGSYLCDKTGVFDVGLANRADLRSMGIGGSVVSNGDADAPDKQSLTFLFAQNQTKANTQTLSLTFRYLWSRTLA